MPKMQTFILDLLAISQETKFAFALRQRATRQTRVANAWPRRYFYNAGVYITCGLSIDKRYFESYRALLCF